MARHAILRDGQAPGHAKHPAGPNGNAPRREDQGRRVFFRGLKVIPISSWGTTMWATLAKRGAVGIRDEAGNLVGYRVPRSTRKESIWNRSSWQRSPQEQWQASHWERQRGKLPSVVWGQFRRWLRRVIRRCFLPYKDYNYRLNPQQYRKFARMADRPAGCSSGG